MSIYMPMVVELVVAMLACARIGAVHSIVVSPLSFATHFLHLPLEFSWSSALTNQLFKKRTCKNEVPIHVLQGVIFIRLLYQFDFLPKRSGAVPETQYKRNMFCAKLYVFTFICQFAGFSAESLCERIMDSQCCLLITAGKESMPEKI